MNKVVYTDKSKLDLKELSLKAAQRIIKKIFFYSSQDNPLKFAKKLKNSKLGQYRFRIGDFRAIFDIDNKGSIKILIILKIKHRKDVYDL